MNVINKLVKEKGISAAREYTSFGKGQLKDVNRQLREWIRGQPFAQGAPNPQYGKLIISGESNPTWRGKKETDNLTWELRFKDQLERGSSKMLKGLDEGLLHMTLHHPERIPVNAQYNSAPRLFDTMNYIQIRVSNGERGWVETGSFPKNVHTAQEFIDEKDPLKGMVTVPVFTDIKRNAKEGFKFARDWAKFRTMAVACSKYIQDEFRQEFKGVTGYKEVELMRNRVKHSIPLMLSLLPDVKIRNGKTAIKPYYKPGVLEAVVALEIEKGINTHFAEKAGDTPIYLAKGFPIEIIPTKTKEGYDAIIPLHLTLSGGYGFDKDEVVRDILENEMQKYFDVNMMSPSDLNVRLHVPNAHKIYSAICEGANNTQLHSQLKSLLDISNDLSRSLKIWAKDKLPVLEEGHKAMVEGVKQKHFGDLEKTLSIKFASKHYA
jgi:hypothetical protein